GKIGSSTSRAHTAFQRANAIAAPLLSVFVSRKSEKVDSKNDPFCYRVFEERGGFCSHIID
ncbi:hypothetical protein, partial [Thiolapillus sp.]